MKKIPAIDGTRLVMYSHDGLGLGHTRRNLNIADAVVSLDPSARCLVVSGSDDVFGFRIPDGVEILKIPSFRKVANEHYEARRNFASPEEVTALRGSLIEAAISSFRPQVLLVDKHPLGINGELRAGLSVLHKAGGQAFLGLRDILDDPQSVRSTWSKYKLNQALRDHFAGIFIYGQKEICDVTSEYGINPWNGRGLHYTGYVVPSQHNGDPLPKLSSAPLQKPLVVVTVGGGEDGLPVIDAALAAHDAQAHRTMIIGGPQGPRRTLPQGDSGIEYCSFVGDMPLLLSRASALVCMGGYNTLSEAMQQAVPTICIPRISPRQEQLIRAQAFAKAGLLRIIHTGQLNAQTLRASIAAALTEPRNVLDQRVRNMLNFDGAKRAAQLLLQRYQKPQGA